MVYLSIKQLLEKLQELEFKYIYGKSIIFKLINKMKISELRKIIKETLGEMAIDEMARTAGTGGGIKISSTGETALRQAKATGQLPEGVKPNHVAILKFLFQAKQDGKRVQKADYAVKMFGDPNQPEDAPINIEARKQQPRINGPFNELAK